MRDVVDFNQTHAAARRRIPPAIDEDQRASAIARVKSRLVGREWMARASC